MRKKILVVLLSVVLLFQFVPFMGFAANAPSYKLSEKSVEVDDEFLIDVSIVNNPGIISLRFKTLYDSSAVELLEVSDCKMLGGFTTPSPNIDSPYTLRWADSLATENNESNGSVITLRFKALKSGVTNIEIQHVESRNTSGEKISFVNAQSSITINEKPVAVTGVTLDKNTLSIKSGEKETLIANITPDNSTNENLIWKSSDESIVTVDKNGLVTGVKKGTATITVTTEDGNYSDTCTVSVSCAHNVTTTYPAKPSTCIEQGNNEYTVCNDCGVIVSGSNDKLPLADHNYIEEVDDIYLKSAATCKDKAIYYKSCSVCRTKGTETFETGELNPDNHVGDTYLVNEKAATCTQNGYTGDIYCKSCDKIISKGNEIPMGDHISDNNWIQTKAPTCTEQGLEIQKCKDCGKTIAEKTIPALGHNYGEWKVTTPATCMSEGIETRTCHCGETETRTIPKSNHQAGEWIVTKEPTCVDNGEKVQKCTVCDEVIKTEIISANGHTPGEWEIVKEATCTEKGEKKSVCTICGEEYTEIIPALGHNFGEWNIIKEPTNTETGEKERACSVCGEKEIVEIPVIEAETDPSTKDTTSEKNNQITTSESHDNANKNTSIKSPATGFDMNVFAIVGLSVFAAITLFALIIIVNRKKKA